MPSLKSSITRLVVQQDVRCSWENDGVRCSEHTEALVKVTVRGGTLALEIVRVRSGVKLTKSDMWLCPGHVKSGLEHGLVKLTKGLIDVSSNEEQDGPIV